jgi:hypothetical protein
MIHHIVFELGKTWGGASLVLPNVNSRECFGTTEQPVVQAAEYVALARQQQVLHLELGTRPIKCNYMNTGLNPGLSTIQ